MIRRIVIAALFSLLPSLAWAQCSGVFPSGYFCGNPTGSSGIPKATNSFPIVPNFPVQSPNTFFAGPTSGAPATPGFRGIGTNDLTGSFTGVTGVGTLTAGALGSGFTTVTVPRGGTGTTSFTANAPLIGGGTAPIGVGTTSGNTTTFATVSGTIQPGHVALSDTGGSGNLVDGGLPASAGLPQITSGTHMAASFAASNFNLSVNGATPLTSASGSIPPINQLLIGKGAAGAGLYGHLAKFGVWNSVTSTGTNLQSISYATGASQWLASGVTATLFADTVNNIFSYNNTSYPSFATLLSALSVTYTRASAGYYYNSSGSYVSAANDTPRFDYAFNGAVWVPQGLLLENASINDVLRSQALATSPWTTTVSGTGSVSVTNNSAAAPDGNSTATLVTVNRADLGSTAIANQLASVQNGTNSGSIFVKANAAADIGKQISVQFQHNTYQLLSTNYGMRYDGSGNLYVANNSLGNILKITPAGAVSTYASGLNTPRGIAIRGTDLYVASGLGNLIYKIISSGEVSTFATGLTGPTGLEFIGTDLYVTNEGSTTIAKVTSGGVVTTFATGLTNPFGIVYDGVSKFYVANLGTNEVLKVDTTTGAVTAFASGFNFPTYLAFDGTNANLYVSNYGNGVLNKVTVPGAVVSTLASGFINLYGVVWTGSGLIVSDGGNNIMASISTGGAKTNYLNGPAGAADIIQDSLGNRFYSNWNTNNVIKITPQGVSSVFATGFSHPTGLAVDTSNNLYVTNFDGVIDPTLFGVITKVTPAGSKSTFATLTGLPQPYGMVFDTFGNLYVADFENEKVWKITPGGVVSALISVSGPYGVVINSVGDMYVSSYDDPVDPNSVGHIYKVTNIQTTPVVTTFKSGLLTPFALSVDSSDNIYMTSNVGGYVLKFTPAGVQTTYASGFSLPFGHKTATGFDVVGFSSVTASLLSDTNVTLSGSWTRVSLPQYPNYDGPNVKVGYYNGDAGSTGSVGILVWGVQSEPLTGVTSYIPTTTAPVTRAADAISAVTWSAITSGTIYVEGSSELTGVFQRMLELSNGANTNSVGLTIDASNNDSFDVVTSGVSQASLTAAYAASRSYLNGLVISNSGLAFPSTTIPTNLTFQGTVGIGILQNSCAGTATLSTGSGTVTNACISASRPVICTDQTAAAAVKCTPSGGSLAITGTGSDVISWAQQ